MTDPTSNYPKPTAQVEPYVRILGTRLAARFILAFGGAELAIAREPNVRSRLVHLVGIEKAREMGQALHLLPRRVPLAKQWLSLVLLAEGLSVADIARTIRASEVSVRKMLPADLRAAARGKKVSDVTPPEP